MIKNSLNLILIIVAIIILIAVGFSIILKYKSLAPSSEVSQTKDNNMAKQKIIRQPAVAGSFYPADKNELQSMINQFFAAVPADTAASGTPKILIVPHAGYIYSGPVAAYSFKQLANLGIKRAIIIGPSHHFPASGLYLSGATYWQTPLGEVKVADLNNELAKDSLFTVNDQIHQPEHSLEIEVPFLQTVAPGIEIVPIIVGELDSQKQADFAQILNQYLDSQTILIVSVDLSHYHPNKEALALDNKSIKDILGFNDAGILEDEIDAPWAVASVIKLAKQNNWQPKLLKYGNSGDVTGDKSAVVGYVAIGLYQENKKTQKQENNQDKYSEAEKNELLQVARTTLEQYLIAGKTYEPPTNNPKFKEERGVFVTLNKNGGLRGCIGYIQPVKPLIEAVRDNAISAAVHDTRFSPVDQSELADLEIEISILTVPKPDTLENISQGKLGVVLQQGSRGATYLPQVWEDLSDPEQFFSSLCLKGGLPVDCYQDPKTEFLSYEAIVFHE